LNYKKWIPLCTVALMLIVASTLVIVNLGHTNIIPRSISAINPTDHFLPISESRREIASPNPTHTPQPSALSTSTATSEEPTQIKSYNGIKVYDENLSQITSIYWGVVALGILKNYKIYVSNVGDSPVTLGLSADNWTPGVNGSISWNYDGASVAVNATVPVTLSLQIEEANVTAFNNDLIVTSVTT
jgi:hypothetical protein